MNKDVINTYITYIVVIVQLLSRVCLFATPWTAACQVSLSFTLSQTLLKLRSIESVMRSNNLILCHPYLLPSIFPSIKVFSSELNVRIRWPKYWIFSIVLPKNIQSFQRFLLGWTGLISLQSKVLSRVFTTTTIQRHQLFGAQPSLWFSSHNHT